MEDPMSIIVLLLENHLGVEFEYVNGKRFGAETMIQRGVKYLNSIAGRPQDYTRPGPAQSLLFDYCRYVRAHALEDFQKNFLHELTALHLSEGVAMYAETQEAVTDV